MYLAKKNLWWDALAASITEVALVFALTNLITGSIWGRQQWGVWWAWDARLTGMLICCLVFAGYLMLRRAMEEPNARARLSAVVSVFGTVNAWFVYKAIDWFPRLQHPGPVLSFRTGGGRIDPLLEHAAVLERAGAAVPGDHAGDGADAAGRSIARNRLVTARGAFLLGDPQGNEQ